VETAHSSGYIRYFSDPGPLYQLTATVEEVNKTADHLARIADDLAAALGRFKTA